MNKIFYIVLVALFLVSCSGKNQKLENLASAINQSSPTFITEGITMIGAEVVSSKSIQFNYEYDEGMYGGIFTADRAKYIEQDLIRTVQSSQELKALRDEQITFVYCYLNKLGRVVLKVELPYNKYNIELEEGTFLSRDQLLEMIEYTKDHLPTELGSGMIFKDIKLAEPDTLVTYQTLPNKMLNNLSASNWKTLNKAMEAWANAEPMMIDVVYGLRYTLKIVYMDGKGNELNVFYPRIEIPTIANVKNHLYK